MSQNDQTLALHAGHNTTKTEGTRAVPIYQTTSYVFDDTDHAAKLFSLISKALQSLLGAHLKNVVANRIFTK